jgi:hypothetical protein
MRIPSLLLGAVLLCLASPAFATDGTGYHAAGCFEQGKETGDFDRSEYRITRIGAAGSGYLLCPIHRMSYSTCVTDWSIRVEVHVIDSHPTADVTCWLLQKDRQGNTFNWSSMTSYGSSTTLQTLTMNVSVTDFTTRYVLKCSMPVNSGSSYTKIHGYYVTEPTGC